MKYLEMFIFNIIGFKLIINLLFSFSALLIYSFRCLLLRIAGLLYNIERVKCKLQLLSKLAV